MVSLCDLTFLSFNELRIKFLETIFSVIIPIYNAEKTLRRCVDSLLSQGEAAAELILINDGSTDTSPDICLEYAQSNRNVRYFSQENRGVSAARNLGLQMAVGTYVLFVDSDDYVDSAYFNTIRRVMMEHEPDLLLFSHNTVGRITYQVRIAAQRYEGTSNVADAVAKSIRDQSFNALWSKVYLRRIIREHHIEFNPELSIDEDLTFSFSYALHAVHIQTISDPLYYFCVDNPKSLSRRQRNYLPEQLLTASRIRFELLRHSGLDTASILPLYDALAWIHYRDVFSIATELQKQKTPEPALSEKLREACSLFIADDIKPVSLPCRLMCLPIRLRLIRFVKLCAWLAAGERKRRLNY